MTLDLILLGAGGHASDLLTAIETSHPDRSVSVASDDEHIDERRFAGRAGCVPGGLDAAFALSAVFVSAIGYPTTRRIVVGRAEMAGVTWSDALVHVDATVHDSVELGSDVVVLGRSWVSAHVRVGAHSNIAYGVTIGHDSTLGSFAAVMPGACISGDVTIGTGVLIGANATVLEGCSIGDGAAVGAGAVVTSDVAAGATVVGVPARQQ